MEALKNFTGYRQRLFLTNDLNKWVRGGTPDLKWRAWLTDFLRLEIFDSGIFLVGVSFTWGFFAYSNQFEVVILMLLMKQKMFSGVSSGVWVLLDTLGFFFGGGGGLILSPFDHPVTWDPEYPTWELGVKEKVATFKITQLAFAHLRQ